MLKVASELEILAFFKAAYGSRVHPYYGFYNSHFDQIITQQQYMLIPMDDRTAIRGHGVFDVLYMHKTCILNINSHIDRLFNSAQSVNIVPPFDKSTTKQKLIEVVEKTVDYHLRHEPSQHKKKLFLQEKVGIRMTISSGFGDFSVASLNKQPVLYMAIFQPYISYNKQKAGVNEFVTKIVDKVGSNPHTKSINYVQNALMANESKLKGGYQGIKALSNRILLEAATSNIAFIFGKQFRTPSFDYVVNGTTLKKVLFLLEELKQKGVIEKITFTDITIQEAYKADEMMLLGGDKIVPVLNFDNQKISSERGPITTLIQEWYEQQSLKSIDCAQIKIDQLLL